MKSPRFRTTMKYTVCNGVTIGNSRSIAVLGPDLDLGVEVPYSHQVYECATPEMIDLGLCNWPAVPIFRIVSHRSRAAYGRDLRMCPCSRATDTGRTSHIAGTSAGDRLLSRCSEGDSENCGPNSS